MANNTKKVPPHLAEPSAQTLMPHLCTACQQFDITPECFVESPYQRNRMYQLGSFNDLSSRTSCSLCCAIVSAYISAPLPYGPRRSSESFCKELRVQGCWQQATEHDRGACLRIFLIQGHEERKALLTIRILGSQDSLEPYFARKVEKKQINVDMVRGWLARCTKNHDCYPSPSHQFCAPVTPPLFRVIDVQQMCIMSPPEACRYLTLSYVWGSKPLFLTIKANVVELSSPGGLKNHWSELSPTIRDAILFTDQIEERYLWVDSLCIVQDGGDEVLDAIHSMDLVYTQALAMICACDDQAPDVGLQGVGKPRNTKNFVCDLGPGLKLAIQHDLATHIENSVYATRGWTYQEEQLASRIFYLTNSQIYLTCLSSIYTEDVIGPMPVFMDLAVSSRVNARKQMAKSSYALTPYYFNNVRIYTSRKLTYSSDILSAFDGVLSAQSLGFRTSTFYGLPTCFFDLALLWQPMAQLERRKDFPSWSWAGWKGGVRWLGDTMELASYGSSPSRDLELKMIAAWHVKHTWIVWQKHASSTGEELSLVWRAPTNEQDPAGVHDIGYRAKYCTYRNTYGRDRQEDINGISNYNIPTGGEKMSGSQDKLAEHLLYFRTMTAKYRIRPSTAYLKYGSLDPNWEPNGRVVFHILNRHNAISGYVLLDENWKKVYDLSQDTEHEFIMLSDANYPCEWARPHEGHPYTKSWYGDAYIEYHAMMITSVEGVSERAGLARIHHEALKDAWGEGPVWKDIILG